MVSKQMENVLQIILKSRDEGFKKRVQDSRNGLETLSTILKPPKDMKLEEFDAAGVPAAWISTPNVIDHNVILYLHGGAYISGSINSHKLLASQISRLSRARVLLIEYRLAPENKFPAAVDDAFNTYKWLLDNEKIKPKNLIIAGDSAGGGLTLATLVKLRDTGTLLPAAAVCLSPWADLTNTGESFNKNPIIDPMIARFNLDFAAYLYLDEEDPRNPLASPVYANLEGLPPILIQTGGNEDLLDDSITFAKRAKEAGVDVTLDIWDDMFHVFQATFALTPEGKQALQKIGEYIQNYFT